MESTPPPSPAPRKRRIKPPKVADLPLFTARRTVPPRAPQPPPAAPPAKIKPATPRKGVALSSQKPAAARAAKAGRLAWRSPLTWLPVIAFGMLIAGIWMLLPPTSAERERTSAPDRSLPTVVIDAGHGGRDGGATNNGLREKDLTLDTALRLERHLRAQGFPVVLTRRDDRFLELFERAQIANKIPRALFVSIHFNDNTTASGDGVETFYAQQKAAFSDDGWSLVGLFDGAAEAPPIDQGASFARSVQASMVAQLGVTDRGAKPRQLAVVRLTRCPAVLVEGGFLNNLSEAQKLAQGEYRERLAAAIADGVRSYMQERFIAENSTTVAQR